MSKRINTRKVGGALVALSLICLSVPAMAEWDQRGHDMHDLHDEGMHRGWHEHAREAHAWRHDHWRDHHYAYGDGGPYETYAPPMVVEPPPAYYPQEDSGVNLVFPLNIH